MYCSSASDKLICLPMSLERISACVVPPVDVGAPSSIIWLGSVRFSDPLVEKAAYFSGLVLIFSVLLLFSFSVFLSCIFRKQSGLSLNQRPTFPHAIHLNRALICSILAFLRSLLSSPSNIFCVT